MKRSTLIRTPVYGLIAGLISFLLWCSLKYRVLDTEGYVTDVFETSNASGELYYDYFIRTEVGLFQCTLDQEQHLIIGELRDLKVMYGEYPTGERTCLYVGV